MKLVLAACNTSSALALPEIQEEFPVPVVGVIEPGVRAALRHHRKGPIALWATEATVASGVYSQKLKAANPGVETVAVPCPKLVPMIESGRLEEPNLTQVLEGIPRAGAAGPGRNPHLGVHSLSLSRPSDSGPGAGVDLDRPCYRNGRGSAAQIGGNRRAPARPGDGAVSIMLVAIQDILLLALRC